MPVFKHKTPCKECPFKRSSPAGYLGSWSADEFLRVTVGERQMECHMAIDYEDKHWLASQYPNAALCAGALMFLRNICKLPRDRALADAHSKVEADRELVFASATQFLEHHKK